MGDRADAGGINCVHRTDVVAGDASHELTTTGAIAANYIQSITGANVQVGSDFSTNQNTIPFHTFALQPRTTGGSDETSQIQDLWITAIEHRRDMRGGKAVLRLHVEGVLRRMKRCLQRASVTHTGAADDYRQVLSAIVARAGASLSVTDASARSDSVLPKVTIEPDTSAHTATMRLLAFLTDRLVASSTSTLNLKELVSGAAADYALANAELVDDPDLHPIHTLRLRVASPPAAELWVSTMTAALAFLSGQAIDLEAGEHGLAPIARLRDLTSDAISEADATADAAIVQLRFHRDDGSLTCPPIVNLEPLDVLSIADPYTAATALLRRVSAITWRYRREGKAVYEQQIDLCPASDQDGGSGGIT